MQDTEGNSSELAKFSSLYHHQTADSQPVGRMKDNHSRLAASAVCLLPFLMIKAISGLTLQAPTPALRAGYSEKSMAQVTATAYGFPHSRSVQTGNTVGRDDADKLSVKSSARSTWGGGGI